MIKTRVISSNIYSISYDFVKKILEIEFKSGEIYQYLNVPQSTYSRLMKAPSHGIYFSAYIKDIYSARKVR